MAEESAPQILQRHIDELAEYMVILVDREGKIRTWNRGAHLLFQYEHDEVVGQHFRILFTDEDVARGAPENELTTALRDGRAPDRRWHKRKDGSIFYSDGLTTVLYEDQRPRGFAKIARDATADRKNEAQLVEVQAITELAHFSESVDDLLRRVIGHLCGVFSCEIAAILLADESERELMVRAGCGIEQDVRDKLRIRVGEGFPGAVAEQRKGLIWDSPDPRRFVSASLRTHEPKSLAGMPLTIKGRLLGVLYLASMQELRFRATDLDLLRVAADRVSLALDNARLMENERQAREQASFLSNAGAVLSSSLDYEKTLSDVAQLAVPRVADWCAVDIADERGRLRRISVAHQDPAKVELVTQIQERFPPRRGAPRGVYHVLDTGESDLEPWIDADVIARSVQSAEHGEMIHSLGLRSLMIVPLTSRSRTFGTLTFASAESGRTYDRDDLEFAQQLANRAAVAIDNARLYREARIATEARDLFMATLSHEMRTPMTSILGWVRMLRGPRADAETMQLGLEAIEQSAHVQARLVDDLLDVSRIITGKLRLEKARVDVAALILDSVSSLEPSARAAGVHIATIGSDRPIEIDADPERLRQVITNLLTNAIKFSNRSGLITVDTEYDEETLTVRVCDTGRGIPQDVLPHIFEPFQQERGMDSPSFGGLGLGLAIVKNIVELHEGTVTAESEGPGQGATFTVVLPRQPRNENGAKTEASAP